MVVTVPNFIEVAEVDQAKELRSYLHGKGALIAAESNDDFLADLSELVEHCAVCWQSSDTTESEIEAVMNSLISLIILLPQGEEIVSSFCEQVSKADENTKWNEVRLRILSNLFNGFEEKSPQRFPIFCSMVKFAGKANLIQMVPNDLKQVKKLISLWDLPKTKVQDLLRNLHDAFVECHQQENATKAMIELLGTYTESTASQAQDDAHRCIVTSLADPATFLLDHLLILKPVKLLEGNLIHELLTIFITGKLTDYIQFYQSHMDFVNSLGLDHEQNIKKMRLLTFMHLAEGRNDIDFDTVQKEIGISSDQVEQFIIDAVKTQTVVAKMDQASKKVLISSATHRTFTKSQWLELKHELESWQSNLVRVSEGFKLILASEQEGNGQ